MGLLDFLSSKDRGARERKAARARKGAELYAAAVAQARQPALYTDLAAPDTLDGRFELIVLHVHLLCRRLGALGAEGAGLAQALFDTMFRDMDRNLRELGVGDLSVGKKVQAIAGSFRGRAAALEKALARGDREAVATMLLRNLYMTGPMPAPRQVLVVADRLRALDEALARCDAADLLTGRLGLDGLPAGSAVDHVHPPS